MKIVSPSWLVRIYWRSQNPIIDAIALGFCLSEKDNFFAFFFHFLSARKKHWDPKNAGFSFDFTVNLTCCFSSTSAYTTWHALLLSVLRVLLWNLSLTHSLPLFEPLFISLRFWSLTVAIHLGSDWSKHFAFRVETLR